MPPESQIGPIQDQPKPFAYPRKATSRAVSRLPAPLAVRRSGFPSGGAGGPTGSKSFSSASWRTYVNSKLALARVSSTVTRQVLTNSCRRRFRNRPSCSSRYKRLQYLLEFLIEGEESFVDQGFPGSRFVAVRLADLIVSVLFVFMGTPNSP